MDIKDLARKPELVQLSLDSEDIVATYGEPVTFYMRDYVDINTYFEFYRTQSEKDGEQLAAIIRRIVLNAQGEPVLGPEDELPIDITVELLVKVNECLGKSKTKSLTPKNGTQPN